LEAQRRFGVRLVEVAEGELGVLAERCRAAGLEGLFLKALKIEKD
jgi:hypothetical protein